MGNYEAGPFVLVWSMLALKEATCLGTGPFGRVVSDDDDDNDGEYLQVFNSS